MTGERGATPECPLVIAVAPVHNRRDLTLRFVRLFQRLTYARLGLVIVDAGSTDGTAEHVREAAPEAHVIQGSDAMWWTGATNLGVQWALDQGADFILTINDDAAFGPDLVNELVKVALARPRCIVGSRQQRADDPTRVRSIGASAVFRGFRLYRWNFQNAVWASLRPTLSNPHPVDTLPGNGVLVPRQVFETVGLYDARNCPHYHADSDLVLRAAREGYEAVVALDAEVYDHVETEPRAYRLFDAVLNVRSPRYWRAVWTSLRRHGPPGFWRRLWLVVLHWLPFIAPRMLQTKLRRMVEHRGRRRASA